jgi:transposase
VAGLVAERVDKTSARISAKRLLPAARAAGYSGSPRNFRRLVAAQKHLWRRDHHRGRRLAVWSPGEHLVSDWGAEGGLHVFCAVLAWCRFRFVRFARDERAETTLAILAQCLEVLGGVPARCWPTGWAAWRAAWSPTSWCPRRSTCGLRRTINLFPA